MACAALGRTVLCQFTLMQTLRSLAVTRPNAFGKDRDLK